MSEESEDDVHATAVAYGEAQQFLKTEESGLLLVQVTNAVFTPEQELSEICCTEIQLVSVPEKEAAQAFGEELKAVQGRLVQARSTGKKRNFTTAALSWEEYFTPEKRRVCVGIKSPPTSPADSA